MTFNFFLREKIKLHSDKENLYQNILFLFDSIKNYIS